MKSAGKSTGDLTEILTIGQVAKRAKWSRKRMWAHLKALNAELNGLLLVNVARGKKRPTWTVSLASLRFVHSEWFKDPDALDDLKREVESLTEENTKLRTRVAVLEQGQRHQASEIRALRPTG